MFREETGVEDMRTQNKIKVGYDETGEEVSISPSHMIVTGLSFCGGQIQRGDVEKA